MSDDKTTPDRAAFPPDRTPAQDPHRAEPPVRPEAEHTRAGLQPPEVRPDHQEDLGPAASLFKTAGKEAASEAGIADAGTRAELTAMGVETEGVEGAQILAIIGITIVAIAVAIVVAIMAANVMTGSETVEREGSVDAVTGRQINADDEARLANYRIVDREAGVYGLPIEEAMRRVVRLYGGREGLVAAPTNFNSLPQVRAISAVPVRSGETSTAAAGAAPESAPLTEESAPVPLDEGAAVPAETAAGETSEDTLAP